VTKDRSDQEPKWPYPIAYNKKA